MITFEDKEDIRSSNLPRKNRITADDINQLKAYANRVQLFDATLNYSSIATVGVNDIGDVTVSNPSTGITRLTFPSGSFTDRIVVPQITVGEPASDYRIQAVEIDGDSVAVYVTDLSSVPSTAMSSAFITIKSYPAS
jgi:hypothetical protein